uniref:Thymidylate kinase n=1 Tax=Ignisphaera aggregans TaxID=334771 RepID=A0A7J3YTB8_9CREN
MTYKVIAICGIDGSGKTTQIKLLEKHLRRRGFRVKRLWFRWVAFLSYPFLALSRLLGYTKWKTISRSNVRYAERRFYMNRALASLWPYLLTWDAFIYSILKIKVRRILGYTILCDRFIPDIVVDLMCEIKDYRLVKRLVGRILLSLIPKDSKLIIIDVAESTAYSRKHDIPSINYLRERRRLYLALARALDIPIVNGEMEIVEVHINILRFLGLCDSKETCYNR